VKDQKDPKGLHNAKHNVTSINKNDCTCVTDLINEAVAAISTTVLVECGIIPDEATDEMVNAALERVFEWVDSALDATKTPDRFLPLLADKVRFEIKTELLAGDIM